jgi:ABC-2 type transport system permease protein
MINKYFEFFKMEIKEDLSDRSRFLIYVISKPIFMLISIIIWTAIFSNSENETIGGFSIEQTINYFIFLAIFSGINYTNLSAKMGSLIYSGQLSELLLKPVNLSLQLTFKSLGGRVFALFYESIPALAFALIFFSFKIPSALMLFFSILSIFLGLIINCFFSLIWSLMYFKLLNHWPFERIKNYLISFLMGSYIPINFLPLAFQDILKYLPFNYFVYEPARIFLNIYPLSQVIGILMLQAFWIIIFYFFFNYLFKKTIKKFEGVGA